MRHVFADPTVSQWKRRTDWWSSQLPNQRERLKNNVTDFLLEVLEDGAFGNCPCFTTFLLKIGGIISDVNMLLNEVCRRGYYDAVVLMVELGASNLTFALGYAIENKHENIVKYLLGKIEKYECNHLLLTACTYSRLDIAKIAVEQGATASRIQYQIIRARDFGDKRILDYLTSIYNGD